MQECTKCGQCCCEYFKIALLDEDIERIGDYIIKNNIEPEGHFHEPTLFKFTGNRWAICPFFDIEARKCKIYEVRPLVCQEYCCTDPTWLNRSDWSLSKTKDIFKTFSRIYRNAQKD